MDNWVDDHPPETDLSWLPAFTEAASRISALLPPHTRTLVDVGCNTGRWCSAFRDQGYGVVGIDVPRMAEHLIAAGLNFQPVDLRQGFRTEHRFGLALCLEVAEHLPESYAGQLVSDLVGCSDLVVFSAAIPGQGGHRHLNEQPFEYWRELFLAHEYLADVSIRQHLPESLPAYYRSNVAIFSKL